ncbi:adhesion G-protein coupled receptor G6 [Caerostris darwini]|uniref:Adhesion G-protein coupled receptor G6 n=1 Tax=Caerostris darwini TaxID=1538125 RepID=A0AAV4QAC4_9ARAC|nr:adhesion G-protein coupled receptor G6 [Caerostris darwini]
MVKVFVPKEALQEAHRQLEGSVRVKFVVYYNDKLFQSKKVSKPDQEQSSEEDVSTYVKIKKDDEEAELKAPVLQISVGNITLKNMYKPLVYILPLVTKREVLCVYWDEKDRRWSTEGLTTNHTKSYVICESSHMTAFSILFDVSPLSARDKTHESIMTIISYIGSILSIIGLSLTILTYMLFGCLNRDHPGKILTQLCFSLLLMNATYLLEAFVPSNGKDICAAIAMLLHYFVLSSLSWMCVEAINMYHLLVYVFGSSETHFMLKRCLFGWGVPFIFVAFTSIFELDSYYVGMEFCMLSPINKWIYYFAFLVPSCVIMGINFVIFLLVARVIFTPRLAANNDHPNVTIAQVRGAFTIMVLLGVTWVFGTLAFGRMKIGFQYAFCISNSVQGFLIFLVRCLLYPEARNSWVYLFKTGKLKKHRGVLPPGTVSFSTSQGPKNLNNASQSSTRATNEESPKIAFDGSLFNKNPEIMESCLILTPTSPGHISLEDFRGGSKEKFIECTPRFMHHNSPFLSKNDLNNFNLKKGRSASISVILDGDHENVASPSKLYTSMEFRSCEPSDKDKRSLSLDVSIPRPMLKKDVGAITKKAKTRITFKNRKSIGRKVQSDDEENSASTDVEDSPTSSVGLPCSDRAVAAPNSDASHKGGLNFQKQSYKKRFRSDDNMSVQNSALFPQPKRYF